MRWLLASFGSAAVVTFTTFAAIAAQAHNQTLAWYSIVLLTASIISIFICFVIGIVYLRKYMIYLSREYQKPPSTEHGDIVVKCLPPAMGVGTEWIFTTSNTSSWKFEYTEPIQAVQFIKPVGKTIRPTDIPAFVDCEHRGMWRLRNKLLGIPTPRIAVKQFTERGIILGEENTYGVDVKLELIPMPPQVKQSISDKEDSQT